MQVRHSRVIWVRGRAQWRWTGKEIGEERETNGVDHGNKEGTLMRWVRVSQWVKEVSQEVKEKGNFGVTATRVVNQGIRLNSAPRVKARVKAHGIVGSAGHVARRVMLPRCVPPIPRVKEEDEDTREKG